MPQHARDTVEAHDRGLRAVPRRRPAARARRRGARRDAVTDVRHQRVVRTLASRCAQRRPRSVAARCFSHRFDVVLSASDVVQPDLLFVRRERAASSASGWRAPPIWRWRSSRLRAAAPTRCSSAAPTSARRRGALDRRPRARGGAGLPARGRGAAASRAPVELAAERGDVVESPLLPELRLAVADIFAEPAAVVPSDSRQVLVLMP